jgi:hypothetical protein
MPKSFIHRSAEKFINEHYDEFNYKPTKIVRNNNDFVYIFFRDLNPCFSFYISKNELCIRINFRGCFWDWLNCFDVTEKRKNTGEYYCNCCIDDGKVAMFSSRYDLWCDHVFSPLLEFINGIRPDDLIKIWGAPLWIDFLNSKNIQTTHEEIIDSNGATIINKRTQKKLIFAVQPCRTKILGPDEPKEIKSGFTRYLNILNKNPYQELVSINESRRC